MAEYQEQRTAESDFRRRLLRCLPPSAAEVADFFATMSLSEFDEYLSSLCGKTDEVRYLVRERGRLLAATAASAPSPTPSAARTAAAPSSAPSVPSPAPMAPKLQSKAKAPFSSLAASTPSFVPGASAASMSAPAEPLKLCMCMATRHACLGNCITCGKIICEAEAARTCGFCGAELPFAHGLRDEQFASLRAKVARASLAAAYEAAAAASNAVLFRNGAGAAGSANGSGGRGRGKAGISANQRKGAPSSSAAAPEPPAPQLSPPPPNVLLAEGMEAALAHKNKLLNYQSNSAARTVVRDDDAEWFPSSSASSSAWLSPAEKAAAEALDLARSEKAAARREVRLEFDFTGGRVAVTADSTADDDAAQQQLLLQRAVRGFGAATTTATHHLASRLPLAAGAPPEASFAAGAYANEELLRSSDGPAALIYAAIVAGRARSS